MELIYLVYVVCIISASIGYWLLLPVRHRLVITNRGRESINALGRIIWRYREFFMENIVRERRDREIYEAISFLRNIITVDAGGSMSADLVLEKLSENRGVLKPVYLRVLSLLRMNRLSEAETFFSDAAGGGLGRDFIRTVLQWDEIDPKELASSLMSYQKSLKESRITEKRKKEELISDLIYIPVVVNVMAIFMNFIYVAYFIGQREMLSSIF